MGLAFGLAFGLAAVALTAGVSLGQTCPTCVPLTDLGTGLYLGAHEGGLYPGGRNTPPPAHAAAASFNARLIVPRDALGRPDADGLVGLISIGMSNASEEFAAFERSADGLRTRDGRVVIVNLAEGGVAAEVAADGNGPWWSLAAERVAGAGLAREQVQVAWLKQAWGAPPTLSFPDHAEQLADTLTLVLQRAKAEWPNLRLVYLASRTYGGYNTRPERSEPFTYEQGFGVKWLIERQIAGDAALRGDFPVLLWGPYLWANGATPRGDGFAWLRADVEADGVHPSALGEAKVGGLLREFFTADASALPWFGPEPGVATVSLEAAADTFISSVNQGGIFGGQASIRVTASETGLVRFDTAGLLGTPLHAKLSLRGAPAGAATVHAVADTPWAESTVNFLTAPSVAPVPTAEFPRGSGGASVSAGVTDEAAAALGGPLSLALRSADAAQTPQQFFSRESADGPRLIVTLRCPADFDSDGTVSIFDLFDFLAALDAGLDYNGDTTPADIFDLFDFLAVIDAGC